MKFETGVGLTVAGVLAGSSFMASIRRNEERARRGGLKGTSIYKDDFGRAVEYQLSPGFNSARATLILDNGLGDPLESWDWIEKDLISTYNVLRYHRRGYCRTLSTLRPAEILEGLINHLEIGTPLHIVAHSFGALNAANAVSEARGSLREVGTLVVIDGTDADLLGQERESRVKTSRFRQATRQQILSSLTGLDRWTPGKAQRDVEYRPDIQQSFITTLADPKTKLAAQREYLTEPLLGQQSLLSSDVRRHVIAAGDNLEQQKALASKMEATFNSVPGSTHRSIIGSPFHAETVAKMIREVVG